MTLSNLPLPDRLAALRAEIKRLEDEESEIRRLLLLNEDMRTGAEWIAEIKEIVTSRVDLKELKAMHKDLVEEYTFPQKAVRVELLGITSDGELVPARRFRKDAVQD